MTVDERSRLQLAEALKRALGDEEGITLMELLPPVGWADVATKHDLLALESRLDLRFESLERGLDAQFDRIDTRFEIVDGRFESLKFGLLGTMERELRSQTWKLFALNAAVMGAMIGALVAVAKG
jgi:hypothetical protein